MTKFITLCLLPIATAALLGGCAAAPTTAVNKPAANAVAATAATGQPAARSGGVDYRKVVKNGVDYFCRKELPTGSRTNATETCLTQAQIDAAQKNSKDLVDRLQQIPGTPSGPGGSGGAYNNVLTR
jgi:hypothetical protein